MSAIRFSLIPVKLFSISCRKCCQFWSLYFCLFASKCMMAIHLYVEYIILLSIGNELNTEIIFFRMGEWLSGRKLTSNQSKASKNNNHSRQRISLQEWLLKFYVILLSYIPYVCYLLRPSEIHFVHQRFTSRFSLNPRSKKDFSAVVLVKGSLELKSFQQTGNNYVQFM